MGKPVHGFIDDIRNRRNIDVYTTIATAVGISILSLFDVVSGQKINSLILAVLAVLAFNMIATRNIMTDRQGQGTLPIHADFAPDLIQQRNNSLDVYLIGVSLSRTIESSYVAFSQNLMRGGVIRILLTDPDADDAAVDARCQSTLPTADQIRQEIHHSLETLSRLKHATGGALEVRMTSSALKFGLNYLDTNKTSAVIHVQLYSYRLDGESRPMFVLRPSDGEWFDCFRSQAEALWRDAAEFNLNP